MVFEEGAQECGVCTCGFHGVDPVFEVFYAAGGAAEGGGCGVVGGIVHYAAYVAEVGAYVGGGAVEDFADGVDV